MITIGLGKISLQDLPITPEIASPERKAIVTVTIDQSALRAGNVLGIDVTATAGIVDTGKPSLEVGDISTSWRVDATPTPVGTVLAEGDMVTAVAEWVTEYHTGSVMSDTLTVPVATLPPTTGTVELSSVPVVGTAVSAVPDGDWHLGNPAGTLEYRWTLDAALIVGETGSSYTPIEADEGASLAAEVRVNGVWALPDPIAISGNDSKTWVSTPGSTDWSSTTAGQFAVYQSPWGVDSEPGSSLTTELAESAGRLALRTLTNDTANTSWFPLGAPAIIHGYHFDLESPGAHPYQDGGLRGIRTDSITEFLAQARFTDQSTDPDREWLGALQLYLTENRYQGTAWGGDQTSGGFFYDLQISPDPAAHARFPASGGTDIGLVTFGGVAYDVYRDTHNGHGTNTRRYAIRARTLDDAVDIKAMLDWVVTDAQANFGLSNAYLWCYGIQSWVEPLLGVVDVVNDGFGVRFNGVHYGEEFADMPTAWIASGGGLIAPVPLPATVSVAIDQSALTAGDVLGIDVTATATVVDAGEPPLDAGDISISWMVDGTPVPAGTTLTEGDMVTAVAEWVTEYHTDSVMSDRLTVPVVPSAWLWAEGDPRESDNVVPADLQAGDWTTVGATQTNLASLDAYAPGPVRVASAGADWHVLRGSVTALETMQLGQQIDVSMLIRRGTSGAKFRFGFIANPGTADQTEAILLRDAAGNWTQTATGLGEFTTPVVDTVTDDSGDEYERIRATFTALDVSGQSVQMRAGPYSTTSGEYVDVHRIGAHFAVVPAQVSVAIDQTAISVGDQIGTDVTATVTLADGGKPAIVAGDIALTWRRNGEPVSTGTTLAEGDTVTARATWNANGNTGSVDSVTRTAIGWVPKLWGDGNAFEDDNAVNASMQAIFSSAAGGVVTSIPSPDAYFPAPVEIESTANAWSGGGATNILTGIAINDKVEVSLITRRGTSALGIRLYLYLGGMETGVRREGDGTINNWVSNAGALSTPVFTLITGSDGRTYERMTVRLTAAVAGDLDVRVTPNAAATIELHRVGAVLVPAALPGDDPVPGTLILQKPEFGNAANTFAQNWAWDSDSRNGGYEHYDTTLSFFEESSTPVMRALYEANGYNLNTGLNANGQYGGFNFRQLLPGGARKEAILEYRFRFRPSFLWVAGGKLPGLLGGLAGGGDNSGGWSMRLMWRGNGDRNANSGNGTLELYAYWYNMPHTYGDRWVFAQNLDQNFIGSWHTIRQRIRTNDDNAANSEIEVWLDGVKQTVAGPDGPTQTVTVELRGPDQPDVDGIFMSSFYGGNTSNWSPSQDVEIDFSDFKVWTP